MNTRTTMARVNVAERTRACLDSQWEYRKATIDDRPNFTVNQYNMAAPARRSRPSGVLRSGDTDSAYPTFGAFLRAVAENGGENRVTDSRLLRAPAGASEGIPNAGGFLVPTEYTDQLVDSIYAEAVLAPLCDQRQTDRASTKVPAIDEQSRADGSRYGGTGSYWVGEADTAPASFPRFRNVELEPKKLLAFAVVSEELLQDAPMLEAHVARAFAAEGSFKLDLAILAGLGAGTPLGLLNSAALITVPKDPGQAPGTITAGNVNAMWSRMAAPCRRRAVWLVNEDGETALSGMTTTIGAAGAVAPDAAGLFAPYAGPFGLYPHLKGRPVLTLEQCPALGSKGDIVLADLSQYVLVDRGAKTALSMDVQFLAMQGVFRFTLRIDGAPLWTSPVTPYNGTATRSPFVTLAARQ